MIRTSNKCICRLPPIFISNLRLNYGKDFFLINEWWRNKLLISSVFGRLLPWRYGLCYWWFGGKLSLPLQDIIEQEEKVFVIQDDVLSRPNNLNVQWYFTLVDTFGTIQSVMSKLRQDTLYKGDFYENSFQYTGCIYIYRVSGLEVYKNTCLCFST